MEIQSFFFGFSNGKLHPGVFAFALVLLLFSWWLTNRCGNKNSPPQEVSFVLEGWFFMVKKRTTGGLLKTVFFWGGCQNPVRLST